MSTRALACTEHVRMRRPPQQRTELHDRNESAEVLNFVFRVRAMDQSGQVEQFGSLVHFRPESVFQHFLRVLELLVIFEHVQVCQDAHDSRHTVNLMATEKKIQSIKTLYGRGRKLTLPSTLTHLTNVEEFENFHFKAKRGVDQQKNQISHFGYVDHRVDVIVALDQRDPPLLSCPFKQSKNESMKIRVKRTSDESRDT